MQNIPHSHPKLRVGIVFGGKSAEHEISVESAKNIIAALDTTKFEPVLIGIDTGGGWHRFEDPKVLNDIKTLDGQLLALDSAQPLANVGADTLRHVDVVFPVLHGPLGEDGTVQGFLELLGLPYVGSGVLSSAGCMDKDVTKRLLRQAGVAVTDFVTLTITERRDFNIESAIDKLGLPLFVKPANMGSSVGVSKVTHAKELRPAIDDAFYYDRKVLIEKAVVGSEIECAVLGNDTPQVSIPGRIIPKAEFYTYEAKYHDETTALEIPAIVSDAIAQQAQANALEAFTVLGCEGMARVDMFVTADGQVLVNEINTIPGFTKVSMYPLLWQASGVPYTALITKLIELATERFEQRQQLRTAYQESA